ncbi:hypothetical protein LCM20_13045 [Halobacillus litoralis]|uniref:hypothetical protein n=1 Tax=Halobacillus litoralis TaxID=45668 RepID=UPI001CD6EEFE|nr:hypothetical protein [Halobacillus litoralis]MCA0971526.1 hypothetical protein [Halobacillus litoralis]
MRQTLFVFLILSLVGCSAAVSEQQLISPFLTSTDKQWNIVVFYEDEPADNQAFQPLQVLLARKGIQADVKHEKLNDSYKEQLQVKDGTILIFDHKGIRYRAEDVRVLQGAVMQEW